jgi:hypothetical protein
MLTGRVRSTSFAGQWVGRPLCAPSLGLSILRRAVFLQGTQTKAPDQASNGDTLRACRGPAVQAVGSPPDHRRDEKQSWTTGAPNVHLQPRLRAIPSVSTSMRTTAEHSPDLSSAPLVPSQNSGRNRGSLTLRNQSESEGRRCIAILNGAGLVLKP